MKRLPLLTALALMVSVGTVAPAQAAFPGAPGPIVFPKSTYTESEGLGGLFAHGPQRRSPTSQLTTSTRDNTPAYSADGSLIAFSGNREAGIGRGVHIYVMNADGTGVRALTSGESYDSNPSFSPNGRQVVFDRRDGSGGASDIYVVGIDGGDPRRLTDDPGKDYDPVYAPNGKWIAFVSDRDHDVRTDRSDILTMRSDGSRVRVLIDGPRNESEPDISPDGRKIVFVSDRKQGPNLFVAGADGRRVRALTRSRGDCFRGVCYTSPAWAPDGKHIACLSSGRYHTDLEVMRADGTQRKEFASGGTEAEGYGTSLGAPAWGPAPR